MNAEWVFLQWLSFAAMAVSSILLFVFGWTGIADIRWGMVPIFLLIPYAVYLLCKAWWRRRSSPR